MFKIGDRVILTERASYLTDNLYYVGKKGTVTGVPSNILDGIVVMWDDPLSGRSHDNCHISSNDVDLYIDYESYLERVEVTNEAD